MKSVEIKWFKSKFWLIWKFRNVHGLNLGNQQTIAEHCSSFYSSYYFEHVKCKCNSG